MRLLGPIACKEPGAIKPKLRCPPQEPAGVWVRTGRIAASKVVAGDYAGGVVLVLEEKGVHGLPDKPEIAGKPGAFWQVVVGHEDDPVGGAEPSLGEGIARKEHPQIRVERAAELIEWRMDAALLKHAEELLMARSGRGDGSPRGTLQR